eukprot:gene1382-1592_t
MIQRSSSKQDLPQRNKKSLYAWNDKNNNGGFDEGEELIAGVEVSLMNSQFKVIQNLTTTTEGFEFDEVEPGKYCVLYKEHPKYKTSAVGEDNKFESTTYCFDHPNGNQVALGLKEHPHTCKIFAIAFNDTNGDGIAFSEPKIDAEGELTKPDDPEFKPIKFNTGTEDKTFENMAPGQYCMKLTVKGMDTIDISRDNVFSKKNSSTCFVLEFDNDKCRAIIRGGFTPASEEKVVIEGFAWNDKNADGKDKVGESYLAGIEATLQSKTGEPIQTVTSVAKYEGFVFDPVPAGSYCIVAKDPSGKMIVSPLGDNKFDPKTSMFCFDTPLEKPFALGLHEKPAAVKGPIEGFAWNDKNNNGNVDIGEEYIPGVEVSLMNAQFKIIQNLTTTAQGFKFDDVEPGKYCVLYKELPKYKTSDVGEDNKFESTTYCFDHPLGDKVALGLVEHPHTCEILALAFNDTNGDGIAFREPNIDAEGELTKPDDPEFKPIKFNTGADVKTFEKMAPGKYCMKLTAKGMETIDISRDNVFSKENSSACFTVEFDARDKCSIVIRGGFVTAKENPALYSIHGHAFGDTNGEPNGIDKGEPYLKGIEITLLSAEGIPLGETNIEPKDKGYKFEDLTPGYYCLKVKDTTDEGRLVSPVIGADNKFDAKNNMYCFTLPMEGQASGTSTPITVGMVTKPKFYNIQVTVFEDKNKNGDNDKEPYYGPMRGTLTKEGQTEPFKSFTIPASRTGATIRDLPEGKYTIKITDPKNRVLPTKIGKDNVIDPANNKHTFTLNDKQVNSPPKTYKFQGGFALKK